MTNPESGYISVIGTRYLYPIASLLEELLNLEGKEPNEVQVGGPENGYSIGIITLLVLMVESFMNRIKHLEDIDSRQQLEDFLENYCPELASQMMDVFVIRDVVVHNHLWEEKIYWDGEGHLKFTAPPKKKDGYGDKKYKKNVDQEVRKTKKLGLNIVPTRIGKRDALIVLRTVAHYLSCLEKIDRNYCYISNEHIRYKGDLWNFLEFVREITENHDLEAK